MNNFLPKLIILDRDGVINYDSDAYIKSPTEWEAIPGSLEAIGMLTAAGIKVAIATNQSGIYREFFTFRTLHSIHQKLLTELKEIANGEISYIAICPHGPADLCSCRKPNPGMLYEISQKLHIPLDSNTYFIGDSYKDVEAAENSGCTPITVRTGKGKLTETKLLTLEKNIKVYDNLFQAITTLLTETK
jgi:D-glycero-D-manno-heptose 1,7-bisphosphate phosphatase